MSEVKAGFMGLIHASGKKVRCTEFSPRIRQDALFYDHIIGLRDGVPSDLLGSKGDDGEWNEQKKIYRAGVKIVDGSIAFPMAELSAKAFFEEACKGDDMDIEAQYTCNISKTFKQCKVNTYGFSLAAGEVANVTVGIMGMGVASGENTGSYDVPEKLLTWDDFIITGIGGKLAAIEFNINNNCMPIYTAGKNINNPVFGQLSPRVIRVGMQQVTGSITLYGDSGMTDQFIETTDAVEIGINSEDFSAKLKVLFGYPERTGSVSAYVRTIPFFGVDKAVQ